MRKFTTFLLLAVVFGSIAYIFYYQEVQYWIPTPIPKNYNEVAIGTSVSLDVGSQHAKKFLHFFNPNCPCSKFNTPGYKALLREYHKEFECFVVIQKSLNGLTEDEREFLSDLEVEVIVDKEKQLARKLGVYATPQMVLLNESNQVYYRGNYNLARYCTNPATNFAKMAIDSLLKDAAYSFPAMAFSAYGCSLDKPTN